jgi:hypothetical protein
MSPQRVAVCFAIDPIPPVRTKISMKEDAVDPSFFNFF